MQFIVVYQLITAMGKSDANVVEIVAVEHDAMEMAGLFVVAQHSRVAIAEVFTCRDQEAASARKAFTCSS